MKIMAAALTMAMVGAGAWAKYLPQNSSPAVTVCADSFVNYEVLSRAKSEASKIFADIAVRIVWSNGKSCNAPDVIHIHMKDRTPAKLQPGALAYARPYEGTSIEVFYDRVQTTVCPQLLPYLLAHVMVHEITHILQGVARHSETGIMKAHWTPGDYGLMREQALGFTPKDVELIQAGLKFRSQRFQTSTVAATLP